MPKFFLLISLFFVFLFLPFIPSMIELFLKKDAKPIPIDLKRKKEPDYFGKSFINLLTTALKEFKIQKIEKFNPVYLKLKLNKEEWVGFLNDEKLLENTIDTPVIFTQDTVFSQNHIFKKELVVFGNAVFKNKCFARSLYVKGNCIIEAPIRIVRWVHVEGTLIINSYADLGVSVYAREIKIRNFAIFKRAYAQKIDTLDEPLIDKKNNKEKHINLQEDFGFDGNIIISGEKRPVLISGNIFCDNDVKIEENVWIKGVVFSQKNIIFRNGVVVGDEGKIKSVVAKEKIFIEGPFRIYGYLHSEKGIEVSI